VSETLRKRGKRRETETETENTRETNKRMHQVRVSGVFLNNKTTKNNNQQRLTKCTLHTNDAM